MPSQITVIDVSNNSKSDGTERFSKGVGVISWCFTSFSLMLIKVGSNFARRYNKFRKSRHCMYCLHMKFVSKLLINFDHRKRLAKRNDQKVMTTMTSSSTHDQGRKRKKQTIFLTWNQADQWRRTWSRKTVIMVENFSQAVYNRQAHLHLRYTLLLWAHRSHSLQIFSRLPRLLKIVVPSFPFQAYLFQDHVHPIFRIQVQIYPHLESRILIFFLPTAWLHSMAWIRCLLIIMLLFLLSRLILSSTTVTSGLHLCNLHRQIATQRISWLPIHTISFHLKPFRWWMLFWLLSYATSSLYTTETCLQQAFPQQVINIKKAIRQHKMDFSHMELLCLIQMVHIHKTALMARDIRQVHPCHTVDLRVPILQAAVPSGETW